MLVPGKRLAVFSIREPDREKRDKAPTIWVRAGSAFVNKDGSMNVWLDVLPIDGKLHVREAGEKRDIAQPPAQSTPQDATAGVGSH